MPCHDDANIENLLRRTLRIDQMLERLDHIERSMRANEVLERIERSMGGEQVLERLERVERSIEKTEAAP